MLISSKFRMLGVEREKPSSLYNLSTKDLSTEIMD